MTNGSPSSHTSLSALAPGTLGSPSSHSSGMVGLPHHQETSTLSTYTLPAVPSQTTTHSRTPSSVTVAGICAVKTSQMSAATESVPSTMSSLPMPNALLPRRMSLGALPL